MSELKPCPFQRPTDLTDGCAALERIEQLEAELAERRELLAANITPEQAIAATLDGMKFYAVDTRSDLDDIGESHIERKLYRTREEAERRAEEVEAWTDDEMGWYASVVEFEVSE